MPRVEETSPISGKVDRSGPFPVVKGVLICGLKSLWGYDYLPEAFDLKAYENAPSYAGHAKDGEQRDPFKKLGWLNNARRRASGELEGDYGVNPKHPHAESFLWAAEHKPDEFRLSHVADVTYGTRDGRKVVTKINAVESVDIVASGGTTHTIFEHAPPAGGRPVKVKEYADKLAPKCGTKDIVRLRWVQEAFGDTDMPADAAAADAPETTGAGGIDEAFLKVCMDEIEECLDAKGDPVKLKRCLGRLKKILSTHGELSGDEVDEADEEDDELPDCPMAKESAPKAGAKKKATETAPAGIDYATAHRECVAEGFTPSPVQITALMGIAKPEDRKTFVKQMKALGAATTPKGGKRTEESAPATTTPTKSGPDAAWEAMEQVINERRGIQPAAK